MFITVQRAQVMSPKVVLILTCLAQGYVGCSSESTANLANPPLRSVKVTVEPQGASVSAGSTVRFFASVEAEDGTRREDCLLAWSTQDASVATVTNRGEVTGISAGNTLVLATADCGDFGVDSDEAQVTVIGSPAQMVSVVIVEPNVRTMDVGRTAQFVAVVRDASGNDLNKTVRWSVEDSDKVRVSQSGVVTALAGSERVELRASVDGVVGTAIVETTNKIVFDDVTVGGPSCGVTPSGTGYCWGRGSSGALGDGTTSDSEVPSLIATTDDLEFVDPPCGLTDEGKALCWGDDGNSQLGDGTPRGGFSSVPVEVVGGHRFRSLSARRTVCGLTDDGKAFCWGRNTTGQLGTGSFNGFSSEPVPVSGGVSFRTLSVGKNHNCGLDQDDRLYCWGQNDFGQFGDGTTMDRAVPTLIDGLRFVTVSAGDENTCALRVSGLVLCWGRNARGRLGDGTKTTRFVPDTVNGGLRLSMISNDGGFAVCGLGLQGEAYCWGQNSRGSLGNPAVGNSSTVPVRAAQGLVFQSISANTQVCGVATTGEAYCWGPNGHGELGNGRRIDSATPVKVLAP